MSSLLRARRGRSSGRLFTVAAYRDSGRNGRWVRKAVLRAALDGGGSCELSVPFREALADPRDAWFAVRSAVERRPPPRPVEELEVELVGLSAESGKQAADRKMYSLKPPWTARAFPMLMFGGLLMLVANLALSATLAFIAHGLFANPVSEIDAATSGPLLDNLQTLQTYQAWLEPFRFVGIATMMVGIALALYTIVRALRFQTERIQEMALGGE